MTDIPDADYFIAFYNGYVDACRYALLHPERLEAMLETGEERRKLYIDLRERQK
jgi:hypothetical protein